MVAWMQISAGGTEGDRPISYGAQGPPSKKAPPMTKRLWEIGDMVDVLEASERANNGR
jgi:hypothetical protein